MAYYNTINQSGEDLKKSRKQTDTQDEIIENWYKLHPYHQLTALELSDILGMLFTSVRRSVTNLIDKGELRYCGMKMERYGKPNNLICLNITEGQQKLF